MAGALFALAVTAACGPVDEPLIFNYSTEEVDANTLPFYESEKLYRYTLPTVNTDSILRALLTQRLPVDEAWLSTEDMCAAAGDPIGPRFTVILAQPTSLMLNFGFESGNGIPGCTTRVLRFTVSRFS